MYNNTQELDTAIQEFLSVPEQYDIVKQTALNIMVKASANNKNAFSENINDMINTICSLHLLHKLSFDEIESEAYYIMFETNVEAEI